MIVQHKGPMSCSYSDIAIQYFDIKALEFNPPVICWKRFRDDIFVVWPHTLKELQVFFNYMSNSMYLGVAFDSFAFRSAFIFSECLFTCL